MDIVGKKKIWLGISIVLLIIAIAAISLWGLNFGIDFKGGTLIELSFNNKIEGTQIKNVLSGIGSLSNIIVQKTGDNSVLIKTAPLTKEQVEEIKSSLTEKIGENREIQLETVGPTIGKDTTKKAIYAVILASIAIIIYIAWAFRTVPKPANSWRFGVCAIIALIHDIVIVIGAYAIFGHFFGYEVDSLFITALLTVMGFSVHDTIVVFDRIRENLRLYPSKTFDKNINDSVEQTFVRSLNTSLTLVIVLLALLVMGGSSIRPFIATLLVGVSIGTYSSIFNASIILSIWQNSAQKKLERLS